MRVYMLNPPYLPHFGRGMRWQDTGRGGTLYYPIWLSYATGVVEEKYKTRLVDAPAWNWDRKQTIEDIEKYKPDLIVMDSSFPSLNNDISVAEAIKDNCPDIKVVLVGPPASQFPERILQSKGIDIVARWEYDFTIKEIAEALDGRRKPRQIKGGSYKVGGEIIHNAGRDFTSGKDLDEMPGDIAVESLDNEQMRDLNRLKGWLYQKRTQIGLDGDRAERRQRKEEEAAERQRRQPALFDF